MNAETVRDFGIGGGSGLTSGGLPRMDLVYGGPGPGGTWGGPSVAGCRVTDALGEGGRGSVWRAMQLSTRREVALKLLSLGQFGSEKARRRFEREVELAGKLEHPLIARVYHSGVHQGVYFYAMELV